MPQELLDGDPLPLRFREEAVPPELVELKCDVVRQGALRKLGG